MNWSAWIEVDLDALAHNFREIQSQTKAQVCPVVKGDAYGHGAPVVVRHLSKECAACFAVGSVEEALTVRTISQAPLLLLTPPFPEHVEAVVRYRLTPTVTSSALVDKLAQAVGRRSQPLPVHMKVDTGLGRLGVHPQDAVPLAKHITSFPNLKLAGVYTHFADGSNHTTTDKQMQEFLRLRERLTQDGFSGIIWHAANSRAFCLSPKTHLDMVRIGTLLYGQGYAGARMVLKDTWALYAKVVSVRHFPAGSRLGYGGTFHARRPITVGVVPVGYGDGLQLEPRSTPAVQIRRTVRSLLLRGQGEAFLNKQPLPIVGKVGMNLTCLDLSGVPNPKPGMVVRLEARRATISRGLPKVYKQGGRVICIWWQGRLMVPSEFDRINSPFV